MGICTSSRSLSINDEILVKVNINSINYKIKTIRDEDDVSKSKQITYLVLPDRLKEPNILRSIKYAFRTWDLISNFLFTYSEHSIDPDIVITLGNVNLSRGFHDALAMSTFHSDAIEGHLQQVMLDNSIFAGETPTQEKIIDIMTHEIGHILGLLHFDEQSLSYREVNILTETNDSIMDPDYVNEIIELGRIGVSDSDKKLMRQLYPISNKLLGISSETEMLIDDIFNSITVLFDSKSEDFITGIRIGNKSMGSGNFTKKIVLTADDRLMSIKIQWHRRITYMSFKSETKSLIAGSIIQGNDTDEFNGYIKSIGIFGSEDEYMLTGVKCYY